MPEVFGVLDDLVAGRQDPLLWGECRKGGRSHQGDRISPTCRSVQIIFNIFRQRPADLFFSLAQQRKTAILARVPLSSGMLTGKMSQSTSI